MALLPLVGNPPSANPNEYTQVYEATHKGEEYLPFMYRSFISFSFGGINIEDFNLISVFGDKGFSKPGYANFEDIVSNHEVLDGQTFWGTHFIGNELSLTLTTDNMTQIQLDDFLLWFSPGIARELVLAEHPNRAILARVKEPPQLNLLPFEKRITTYLGNFPYETSTTTYRGDINIKFIMDDPFWYSKINIFGYQDNAGVYHDTWTNANGYTTSVYQDKDALKIAVEDGIPISSMLQTSLLLGNNIFANLDSEQNAIVAHPYADVKIELDTSGDNLINFTSYVYNITDINHRWGTTWKVEEDEIIPHLATIEREPEYNIVISADNAGIIDENIRWRIYNMMREYSLPSNNPICIDVYNDNTAQIYNKLYNWFLALKGNSPEYSFELSNKDSIITTNITNNLQAAINGTITNEQRTELLNNLGLYDFGAYPSQLFREGENGVIITNIMVANILLQNITCMRGIKDWNIRSICPELYDNQTVKEDGARVAGAIMDSTSGIAELQPETGGYFYYAGTAPSKPKLKFTIIPEFTNYYISSPLNNYTIGQGIYNTITIESTSKQEFRFTTPGMWTGYNQAIEIFHLLDDNMMAGQSWEVIREKIRTGVKHYLVRAWANRVIDSITLDDTGKISNNVAQTALKRMQLMFTRPSGERLSTKFEFNSATGTATGVFQCKVASDVITPYVGLDNDIYTVINNTEMTVGDMWNSYGTITSITEDTGDMVRSPYLIIKDRNYPDAMGNIVGFERDKADTYKYSHIIYHDMNNSLYNVFIEYSNMYL